MRRTGIIECLVFFPLGERIGRDVCGNTSTSLVSLKDLPRYLQVNAVWPEGVIQ